MQTLKRELMRALIALCICAGAVAQSPAKEIASWIEQVDEQTRAGDLKTARQRLDAALASVDELPETEQESRRVLEQVYLLGDAARRASADERALRAYQFVAQRAPTSSDEAGVLRLKAISGLGLSMLDLGARKRALRILEEAEQELAEIRDDDDIDLQGTRQMLALACKANGDLRRAYELEVEAVRVFERELTEDNLALQTARENLATSKKQLGDYRGAHELELLVLAARKRLLPGHDDRLQMARSNLAVSKKNLGDLNGARELEEEVLRVRTKMLPPDHRKLQFARGNLARTLRALGNPARARELEVLVLEVFRRTLDADHPHLMGARLNLANTNYELGRYSEARQLSQEMIDNKPESYPDDHSLILDGLQLEATILRDLGEVVEACELFERVAAGYAASHQPTSERAIRARVNLAAAWTHIGEASKAKSSLERDYSMLLKLYPDHSLLATAESNLAWSMLEIGDATGALELSRRGIDRLTRKGTSDDLEVMRARMQLARTQFSLNRKKEALRAFEELHASAIDRLDPGARLRLQLARHVADAQKSTLQFVAARDTEAEALRQVEGLDNLSEVLTLESGLAQSLRILGDLDQAREMFAKVLRKQSKWLAKGEPSLERARRGVGWCMFWAGNRREGLDLLVESARASRKHLDSWSLSPREIGTRTPELMKVVSVFGSLMDACDDSHRSLVAEQLLLMHEAIRGAEVRAMRRRSVAKRRAPARHADLLVSIKEVSTQLQRVAQQADSGSAELLPLVRQKETLERELTELGGSDATGPGHLSAVDLAQTLPRDSIGISWIEYLHIEFDETKGNEVSSPHLAAMVLARDGSTRWIPLGEYAAVRKVLSQLRSSQRPSDASSDLRGERVGSSNSAGLADYAKLRPILDPVLAHVPENTRTLVVSLPDGLQLIPIDAIPLDDKRLLGDAFRVVQVPSLVNLVEDRTAPKADEASLVLFGDIQYGSESADASSHRDQRFESLPHTAAELDSIRSTFEEVFEKDPRVHLRRGDSATTSSLAELAPTATYLHLATHGYFASPSSGATDATRDSLSRFDSDWQQAATRLSPLTLTGIALAGANDPTSKDSGLLTAEQLVAMDLSNCYLVALSACETSLGVHRAGQGFASLRAAVSGAGARYVLATLWPVDDKHAMRLMKDFYERLWRDNQDPHTALWAAKAAARKSKMPFADWSGWVLTGL